MSGVAVIRYLLANNAPVLGVVPVTDIIAGDFPLKTSLPAISIRQISSVPRLTVAMTEPTRMHTERVQVTVLVKDQQGDPQGADYPGFRSLLKLVLAACPNTRGVINGVHVDSILPDVEGPDLSGDGDSIITGSRDLIVKYFE